MNKGEASLTAKICAFTRAHHAIISQEPIFYDKYALSMLGQDEYEAVKNLILQILNKKSPYIPPIENWDSFINDMIAPIILPRLMYTEEQLAQFVLMDDQPVQYVILGAGLDTFLYRNTNPAITIYELDHPDTQQYKRDRIAKLGWKIPKQAHLVPIDFEKQSVKQVLLQAGFDPEIKSFFSILGVSYYLKLDTFAETLHKIADIAEGECRFVFDYPDREIVTDGEPNQRMKALMEITAYLGEQMQCGMCYKELADAFDESGFHISEHMTAPVIQEKYLNRGNAMMKAYDNISFVLAEKNSSG